MQAKDMFHLGHGTVHPMMFSQGLCVHPHAYTEFGFISQPVVDEVYYVPSTGLRSVRPKGTLNSTLDAHRCADEIKVHEKEGNDLWNQDSERDGAPRSKEALWGRGLYWVWKIEQNLDKEKRRDSWQEEWGEEKNQAGNEEAGVNFLCRGDWAGG